MSFWKKGEAKPKGNRSSLPVHSVANYTQAEALATHYCVLSYDGQDWIYPGFDGTIEALDIVSERFIEDGW